MTDTSFAEDLVYFPCGAISLAGILAAPANPNGQAVIIPWGGGSFPSSARNRVRARLARTLAQRGFHTLRFDNIGVGESEGEYRTPDLSKPKISEIVAASAFAKSRGLDRQVLIGHCLGGWSALVAARELDGLAGVVVLNSPVGRDHQQVRAGDGDLRWWMSKLRKVKWKDLMRANRRTRYRKALVAKATALVGARGARAAKFSDAVGDLIDRQIPLLLIYGTDDSRSDLEMELERGLRVRLEAAGPSTRLVTVRERLEGFATLTAQQLLVETVVPWLDDLALTASHRV
jgi:pimeloyl-ACP methyl ester carboxylesterase